MKNLSKTATAIFCKLLQKANNTFHQFETSGFMPLILSHVSPVHGSTGKHTGELYELAHTFVQEGTPYTTR